MELHTAADFDPPDGHYPSLENSKKNKVGENNNSRVEHHLDEIPWTGIFFSRKLQVGNSLIRSVPVNHNTHWSNLLRDEYVHEVHEARAQSVLRSIVLEDVHRSSWHLLIALYCVSRAVRIKNHNSSKEPLLFKATLVPVPIRAEKETIARMNCTKNPNSPKKSQMW